MIRLRNAASHISRLFPAKNRKLSAVQVGMSPEMAEVARVIHERHSNGLTTTLRQLHKISSLSQPQALTLIHELERVGIVQIESNVGDAFESTITITENALQALAIGWAEEAS